MKWNAATDKISIQKVSITCSKDDVASSLTKTGRMEDGNNGGMEIICITQTAQKFYTEYSYLGY